MFYQSCSSKNPGWITKMSKLEEVKSELNFLTNRKKLISIVRLDGLLRKNTSDSTFKTNKIYQFQTNVGFAEKS